MIEWFDDLALGMRFITGEVSVTKEDIKRFAASSIRSRSIWMKLPPRKPYSKGSQRRVGTLRLFQ
jgi:hypothetical protein